MKWRLPSVAVERTVSRRLCRQWGCALLSGRAFSIISQGSGRLHRRRPRVQERVASECRPRLWVSDVRSLLRCGRTLCNLGSWALSNLRAIYRRQTHLLQTNGGLIYLRFHSQTNADLPVSTTTQPAAHRKKRRREGDAGRKASKPPIGCKAGVNVPDDVTSPLLLYGGHSLLFMRAPIPPSMHSFDLLKII